MWTNCGGSGGAASQSRSARWGEFRDAAEFDVHLRPFPLFTIYVISGRETKGKERKKKKKRRRKKNVCPSYCVTRYLEAFLCHLVILI